MVVMMSMVSYFVQPHSKLFILLQQLLIVEFRVSLYYLSYPCQKLNAWWVVHKVNPCELVHTPCDVWYHYTLTLDDDVDEVYQEEELITSFTIDPGAGLDDLVGDADEIEMTVVVKQK
jgi:hypothetical protein